MRAHTTTPIPAIQGSPDTCYDSFMSIEDAPASSWSMTLPVTVPCRRCRYNLRGVRIDSQCPECGLPVRRTVPLHGPIDGVGDEKGSVFVLWDDRCLVAMDHDDLHTANRYEIPGVIHMGTHLWIENISVPLNLPGVERLYEQLRRWEIRVEPYQPISGSEWVLTITCILLTAMMFISEHLTAITALGLLAGLIAFKLRGQRNEPPEPFGKQKWVFDLTDLAIVVIAGKLIWAWGVRLVL